MPGHRQRPRSRGCGNERLGSDLDRCGTRDRLAESDRCAIRIGDRCRAPPGRALLVVPGHELIPGRRARHRARHESVVGERRRRTEHDRGDRPHDHDQSPFAIHVLPPVPSSDAPHRANRTENRCDRPCSGVVRADGRPSQGPHPTHHGPDGLRTASCRPSPLVRHRFVRATPYRQKRPATSARGSCFAIRPRYHGRGALRGPSAVLNEQPTSLPAQAEVDHLTGGRPSGRPGRSPSARSRPRCRS